MAGTGVLPFLRGVDFSGNDFKNENFPYHVSDMIGLRWLRLDKTNLDIVPPEIANLQKLEYLSLTKNSLLELHEDLCKLPNLRSLICHHNKLRNSGIPNGLLSLSDLSVLDLSNNHLKEIPDELDKATGLLVLNLSNNMIETIPTLLFLNLTELAYLNLSDNKLETLPPQMRRLTNLQTLILNNNPLPHAQLRMLTGLTVLETLHMRHTQRTLSNFPTGLEALIHLQDIDLADNELGKVPDTLLKVSSLKRLNLSGNKLLELPSGIDTWENLEVLNVSRNKLTELPATLCRVVSLRKLYLNNNVLTFNGIPSGIGKLSNLEVFSAAHNNLETIPEGVCRCGKLKKLILNANCLLTLPDAIHYLTDLEELKLEENSELVMPPKPPDVMHGAGIAFYNIDFSLQHQLQLAGAPPTPGTGDTPKKRDHIARLKRLRNRTGTKDSDKVLKGMQEVAKTKDKSAKGKEKDVEEIKGKKWDEAIERPDIDYSQIFEEEAGKVPGILCWEIENFLPIPLDDAIMGKFYEADCYIVLRTYVDESNSLNWQIWYWIGAKATLDKKACAAIHAVNLRNLLGANGRCQREEMQDESEEFLDLFEYGLSYIEGGRTASGFYAVEDVDDDVKMFRVSIIQQEVHINSCKLSAMSLDPRYTFIVDAGRRIFVWMGKKSSLMVRSKGRLVAEKLNKDERKSLAEVINVLQTEENKDFWDVIGDVLEDGKYVNSVPDNWLPARPVMYKVGLGMGYLELPQVELPQHILTQKLLDSRGVYILDCFSDVFVWIGKKSPRLVRAAAMKLSLEVCSVLHRPDYVSVTRCLEGCEPQIFKTQFKGWDDIIPVDYTRTSESVRKRGIDLNAILERDKMKTDLSALFMPRQPSMSSEEAEQLMQDWNEDLDGMESFVLEGKKFVRLPDDEFGHFYTEDCYVFLCRYWVPVDVDDDEKEGEEGGTARGESEDTPEDEFKCTVYFWQGRNASNMGWLTFTFSLQKKFESLFGDKLEVVRMHQQQENIKFLSHFKHKFIIHQGRRKNHAVAAGAIGSKALPPVQFFQIRTNGSPLLTRCIQIDPDPSQLNSEFCHILMVPFDSQDNRGIVYVWIGDKVNPEEARLAEEIADDMFGETHTVQIVNEGHEPENFFWVALGGKKHYDKHAEYMRYTRLFRCSNDKGYFSVSEKCTDFCQDDLADDDVMILDNGTNVFLWVGKKTSDVEIKLAFKSAQVYIQHQRIKQPDRQRKLQLTVRGKEPKVFTKCFHGWGKHREAPQ